MILYSKECMPVEFEIREFFNDGACADIYRFDDVALKVYKELCDFHLKMKKNNFELLKKIDAPCLVKLRDYYFKYKYSSMVFSRVYAYTMDFIEEEKFDILTCDKEFLLWIVARLDETIKKLSEYDIIMNDIKPKNLVMNSDGITFIDLDLYDKRRWNRYDAYTVNKAKIIALLNYIIRSESCTREMYIDELFINEDKDNTLLENIKKQLTEDNIINIAKSKMIKTKKR